MSSRADQIREQAARVRGASAKTGESAETESAIPPLARNIRRSVELSPAQYDALEAWQRQAARRLGRTRVTGQDALSGLVSLVLGDEAVADKLFHHLRQNQR